MAKCDYCESYILFGGKKQGGRTFCNDDCLVGGKLMLAADRLPQHVVNAAIEEAHQGECPECDGEGPIDVHNSHTIWSALYLTSWKSTPNLCCRSCGRKRQLTGLISSSILGWWGFPWGAIFTPIQIGKNLSGMLGGPDPAVPSEQLETIVRIDLASRIAAGQPLPGQKRRPTDSRQASAEPADDRIPVECEACGKRFKAKEEMAGRSGKCPGCGSEIVVPELDVWEDEEDGYEEEVPYATDYRDDDRWEDDGESYDDYRQDRSSNQSPRQRKKPKKQSGVFRIFLIVAGVFVALSILGAIVGFAVAMLEDDKDAAPQIAQNDQPPVQNPVRPEVDPNRFQPPAMPDINFPRPDLNHPNLEQAPRLSEFPSGTNEPDVPIPPVKPLENVDRNASVWVVLSNLREGPKSGFGSFNKPFLIDYQVASGAPAPDVNYVLHLSKSIGGGTFYQTVDVPVKLEASGTIDFKAPPQFGHGSDFVATISKPNGPRKWKHFSGELRPGGEATAAQAPPSIIELAGADARGKPIAIANPEFTADVGLPTLSVGFVLQQPSTPGGYYFLIATTSSGQKIEFDIARNLRQTTVGEESTFGGQLIGPGGLIKPPFSLHVEKRNQRFPSRVRPETPEIVSNKIELAG